MEQKCALVFVVGFVPDMLRL